MTITNNKPSTRYIFYKVAGITRSVRLRPFESIDVPEIVSEDQIVQNGQQRRLSDIIDRTGRSLVPAFSFKSSSTNSTVQSWLNKIEADGVELPSQRLVRRLTNAFNYAESNGILSELDLLAVFVGDRIEHARVPFIHSGGASRRFTDYDENIPTLYSPENGVLPNNSLLNYAWSALTDGDKYELGNGMVAAFMKGAAHGGEGPLYAYNAENFSAGTLMQASSTLQIALQATDGGVTDFLDAPLSRDFGTIAARISVTVSGNTLQAYQNGAEIGFPMIYTSPIELNNDEFKMSAGGIDGYGAFAVGSSNIDQAKLHLFLKMACMDEFEPYANSGEYGLTYAINDLKCNSRGNTAHTVDETGTISIHAHPLASARFTITPPLNFEVFSDGAWTGAMFSYIGEPTLKFRLRGGLPSGTYVEQMRVTNGIKNSFIQLSGRSIDIHTRLLTWQSNLTGNTPSGDLVDDLNRLFNGLEADGEIDKMDFMHSFAGMETEEQQLWPFVSAAGKLVKNGNVTLSAAGSRGSGVSNCTTGGYIISEWRPSVHGVNYTQNNAGILLGLDLRGTANRPAIDFQDNSDIGRTVLMVSGTTAMLGGLNGGAPIMITGASYTNGFFGLSRTGSTGITTFYKGNITQNVAQTSTGLAGSRMFFHNKVVNDTCVALVGSDRIKSLVLGSGTMDMAMIKTRLNTFFSNRGTGTLV